MSKFFCIDNSVDSTISVLAEAAGLAVKLNNPGLAPTITLAATGLLEVINGGVQSEVVNTQLQKRIVDLLDVVTDEKVKIAIKLVLSKVKINVDTNTFVPIELPLIKTIVGGFLEGLAV